MTRRDTIISAALINAGLLVVLFVCALGIDEGSQANAHSAAMTPAIHAAPVIEQHQQEQAPVVPQVQEISLEETLPAVKESKKELVAASHWIQIEIQKGDRIDKVASRHGMSVEELLQANDLQTTQLVVGQKLRVRSSALSSSESQIQQVVPISKVEDKVALVKEVKKEQVKVAPQPVVKQPVAKVAPSKPLPVTLTPAPEAAVQYHYVQRGESPWVIAKKYGLSVEKLLKLNNLDEATARRLREGDRLRVR